MSLAGAEPAARDRRLSLVPVWPVVRALVGMGILVALAVRLGADPFRQGLRAVGIRSLLAALGIGALTTVFSAWRWCLVARSLGLPLPLGQAVAECYRSLFLNSVLPAGVLGDVNRAVSHGRRSGALGPGVRAVVFERTAGQIVLVAFAAAVLVAHPDVLVAIYGLLPRPSGYVTTPAIIGATVVAALVVTLVVSRRRSARISVRPTDHPAGPAPDRTAGPAPDRTAAPAPGRLVTDRPRPAVAHVRTWAAVAALSSAALLGYLTMFVIAARTAGSPAPVTDLLPVLVLALLAMGLPLSIGGWGPREAVTTAAFGAAGLGAAQGLTVAVVYGALSFVACLPGAVILLLGFGFRRRRVLTC